MIQNLNARCKGPGRTRVFFSFLIISLMLAGIQAQISLEHTYNFSGTLTELEDGVFKYFVQDVPLGQCRIYNEDHTLFKTINLSIPGGYYLNDTKYVSKYIFNEDDYIEVLYIYFKTVQLDGELVYYYGLKVINELGTVLLNLDNGGFADIQKGPDGSKLLAYQYIWATGYYFTYTKIYSLGGTMKSASLSPESSISIYPNPASDLLTVTINPEENIKNGQVIITDMSGRQICKEQISRGEHLTRIETGWMSPGSYLLSLISNEKIIESEKIEIK